MTNCPYIIRNEEFDFIDDELIDNNFHCSFPHYENGKGCTSCPVYRQIFESNKTHTQIDEKEKEQKEIQLWWV